MLVCLSVLTHLVYATISLPLGLAGNACILGGGVHLEAELQELFRTRFSHYCGCWTVPTSMPMRCSLLSSIGVILDLLPTAA